MGLDNLDGFSPIYIVFHIHKSEGYDLKVKPFLDNEHRGVFATRSPKRPNAIGLSIVEIERVEANLYGGETLPIFTLLTITLPLIHIKSLPKL